MKIHTPLFIIGLLTFVTPFLGLPSMSETIIIACYGIAIMLIVSTINLLNAKESGRSYSEDDDYRSEESEVEEENEEDESNESDEDEEKEEETE